MVTENNIRNAMLLTILLGIFFYFILFLHPFKDMNSWRRKDTMLYRNSIRMLNLKRNIFFFAICFSESALHRTAFRTYVIRSICVFISNFRFSEYAIQNCPYFQG